MPQPSIVYFGSEDVEAIPMLSDDQTFTGANTFSGATVLDGAVSGTGYEADLAAKSDTGHQHVEADITDLGTYLTTETDPVFTAWDKDYGDLINTPNSFATDFGGADLADLGTKNHADVDWSIASVSTNTSVTTQDVIIVTATADITLPNPATFNRPITIKRWQASLSTIRVLPYSSETIEGAASKTLADMAWITVVSNGTNWFIINSGGVIT